jgi:hypothetical protein
MSQHPAGVPLAFRRESHMVAIAMQLTSLKSKLRRLTATGDGREFALRENARLSCVVPPVPAVFQK